MTDSRYLGWSPSKSGLYHLIIPVNRLREVACRRNLLVEHDLVQKIPLDGKMCKKCEQTIRWIMKNPQKTDSSQTTPFARLTMTQADLD